MAIGTLDRQVWVCGFNGLGDDRLWLADIFLKEVMERTGDKTAFNIDELIPRTKLAAAPCSAVNCLQPPLFSQPDICEWQATQPALVMLWVWSPPLLSRRWWLVRVWQELQAPL